MFIAVQLLIVKFAARCSLYTWCTEIPQLWDVGKVMWNILIQTSCSYTIGKYFKQLIKYYLVAICLQLYSYLQSNLQHCRCLYTQCTEIPQLWDVEKVMWNILIQTACSYTIGKYFKQLIKDQQVAICLQLYSYLYSNLQPAVEYTLSVLSSYNCGMQIK